MAISHEKVFESEGLSSRTTELWRELDLLMAFHERVDGRCALLFGVNAALMGTLAGAAPPPHLLDLKRAALIVVTVGLLAISIARIYRGLFPNLGGPMNSIIYFKSAAAYVEDDYVREWQGISVSQLLDDLARQAWQNSHIITAKFRHLKVAFAFTLAALIPWTVALEVLTWGESTAKSLIGH